MLERMTPRPEQAEASQLLLADMRMEACEYVGRKVELVGSCWVWLGKHRPNGYGRASFSGLQTYAHRFSYMAFIGTIPEGLVIDHLCKVRGCVNPDHLEAVTQKLNLLRSENFSGYKMRQTHCGHGHLLEGSNIVLRKGRRNCLPCEDRRDKTRPMTPCEHCGELMTSKNRARHIRRHEGVREWWKG